MKKAVQLIYLITSILSAISFILYFVAFLVALFLPSIDLTSFGVESWTGPSQFWITFLVISVASFGLFKGVSKDLKPAKVLTGLLGVLLAAYIPIGFFVMFLGLAFYAGKSSTLDVVLPYIATVFISILVSVAFLSFTINNKVAFSIIFISFLLLATEIVYLKQGLV